MTSTSPRSTQHVHSSDHVNAPAVTAAVCRCVLLLLLLGVDRPNDFVLPPVVEAFEIVLPGRVADGAVLLSLRFLQGVAK